MHSGVKSELWFTSMGAFVTSSVPSGPAASAERRLWNTILELGLEDLIPLPEIAMTVRARRLVVPEIVIAEVSAALIALLQADLIQVWSGHWSTEPDVLDPATALEFLVVPEQYEFNSPADLTSRAYYVNVENLRVDSG